MTACAGSFLVQIGPIAMKPDISLKQLETTLVFNAWTLPSLKAFSAGHSFSKRETALATDILEDDSHDFQWRIPISSTPEFGVGECELNDLWEYFLMIKVQGGPFYFGCSILNRFQKLPRQKLVHVQLWLLWCLTRRIPRHSQTEDRKHKVKRQKWIQMHQHEASNIITSPFCQTYQQNPSNSYDWSHPPTMLALPVLPPPTKRRFKRNADSTVAGCVKDHGSSIWWFTEGSSLSLSVKGLTDLAPSDLVQRCARFSMT